MAAITMGTGQVEDPDGSSPWILVRIPDFV